MEALETAATGVAEGSLTVARGRGWVPLPPTGTVGAPAGRAGAAGVAGRGGVAPRGMVLLPTGATGGAGRGGAPGAEGAVGAGGAPPKVGRGGALSGTVGAGGAPMEGMGRGARGTVAGGASDPGALGRRVMRTVSFFRGIAEVLVVGRGEGVGAFSSWLRGKGRGGGGNFLRSMAVHAGGVNYLSEKGEGKVDGAVKGLVGRED